MRRFLLFAVCSLALLTSCADEVPGDEGEADLSSVEQGVISTCASVPLNDWRDGQRLFSRSTRNPRLVLTGGDREETFYAWGVENGERVMWVLRVADRDYGSFMANVHRDWAEIEQAGSNSSYGVLGSINKGGPIPPPPPIGFPPEMIARILHGADSNLAGTEHMFNGLNPTTSTY